MKVLRHEEFEKGCEAACNGPYDGRWSKTMVGYGPEDQALKIVFGAWDAKFFAWQKIA